MLVEASNACVPASEPCLLLFEIFIEMLKWKKERKKPSMIIQQQCSGYKQVLFPYSSSCIACFIYTGINMLK
jgi:hypothetical protein